MATHLGGRGGDRDEVLRGWGSFRFHRVARESVTSVLRADDLDPTSNGRVTRGESLFLVGILTHPCATPVLKKLKGERGQVSLS